MSEKISYLDLVRHIATRTDKSQRFTRELMKELSDSIESGLQSSGSVAISGFGKFELKWMKERKGIHPQSGEAITIPAQNKVVFKPSRKLRESVNHPYANLKPQILNDPPADALEREVIRESNSENLPPDFMTGADSHDLIVIRDISETDVDGKADSHISTYRDAEPVHSVDSRLPELKQGSYHADSFEDSTKASKGSDEAEATGDVAVRADAEAPEEIIVERQSPLDNRVDNIDPLFIDRAEAVQKNVSADTLLPKTPEDDPGEEKRYRWSYISATTLLLLAIIFAVFLSRENDPALTQTPGPETVEMQELPSVEEFNANNIEETGLIVIMTESGQTLWDLADEYIGDSYLWPWIYHLNNTISNPNILRAGADLTIPVPSSKDQLNDEELKEVSLGYVRVYEWYKEQNTDNARYFLWAAGFYSPDLLDEAGSQFDPADLQFARNR